MKQLRTLCIGCALALGISGTVLASDSMAPYGTSKTDLHDYPTINAVFDTNYMDPNDLNVLYAFVSNSMKPLKGKMVVVTHGPELRVFAKENYAKYQGIVDKMKALADDGVEFRMCHNALRAAGFKADDFHGFITVVPAGFPEIALLQSQGYQYINPLANRVRDTRYLDHPELKKK
ncbi:MAG: DsrE family protein [Gammaproteobacteria bacterium]|nr:DsrE family protein [Gammaproteobacteria bacterium]